MSNRHLTDPFIRNLKAPESRTEIYDDHKVNPETNKVEKEGVKGLALRITPTGHKSFVYRYRFNKKVKRFTIGSYPKMGLAKAREEAKELSYKVTNGIDPADEKKARKSKPEPKTINDLAEEFKARHFPKLKASTINSYKARINAEIIPAFGKMAIKDITRGDIISFLEEIVYEREQPVHANRVRNVFSRMFSFGVEKGICEYNPVSTVKPIGEETSRKRVYSEDEIKAIWEAIEQQEQPTQGVLKMLMICGQRKGETCKMQWGNIEDDVWTIPDDVTKNGRTHYVPLSGMAIQVLEQMKALYGDQGYVFPSRIHEDEPIRWIQDSIKRVRDASKVKDFRMHDLRRTAASHMAKLGIDRTALGKVLNHKGLAGDSQVTAIYDRYEYMDEKREALQRWSVHLKKIIEGDTEAKITKIG